MHVIAHWNDKTWRCNLPPRTLAAFWPCWLKADHKQCRANITVQDGTIPAGHQETILGLFYFCSTIQPTHILLFLSGTRGWDLFLPNIWDRTIQAAMKTAAQAGILSSIRCLHIFSPAYVGDPKVLCRYYFGWGQLTFLYLAYQHVRPAARMMEINPYPTAFHTGTVWFYTSTSNKRAARPKLYTESLTRDLKLMYSRLTLVRIYIKL